MSGVSVRIRVGIGVGTGVGIMVIRIYFFGHVANSHLIITTSCCARKILGTLRFSTIPKALLPPESPA